MRRYIPITKSQQARIKQPVELTLDTVMSMSRSGPDYFDDMFAMPNGITLSVKSWYYGPLDEVQRVVRRQILGYEEL